MKFQDIFFVAFLIFLIIFRRNSPKTFIVLGIICFVISVPLFYFWIFFTAQRVVMYGAGFVLLGLLLEISKYKSNR